MSDDGGEAAPECTFEQCRHRDGFGLVTDDAPAMYGDSWAWFMPFRCPEHGRVYELVYKAAYFRDAETHEEIATF